MFIRPRTLAFAFLPLLLCAGCTRENSPTSSPATQPTSQPVYNPLTPSWAIQMAQQRALVRGEITKRYHYTLDTSEGDLPFLQRLIDDRVFTQNQTYELQAIGICFGDVLARKLDLHWVLVSDEWGTDPTLRFHETSIQVNALTMISKRVEESREIRLQGLLTGIESQIQTMKNPTKTH